MRNRVVVMPVQRFSVVVPKRGVQRLIQKKPAAKKYANYKKVPYTRTGTDVGPRGVRKEQSKSKRSLPEILRASNEGIVRMLLADGMLPNWAGMQCPRCEKGTLSKLVCLRQMAEVSSIDATRRSVRCTCRQPISTRGSPMAVAQVPRLCRPRRLSCS